MTPNKMLPPVYEALAASAVLVGLLGGQARVYRHGYAPQGTRRPYITWTSQSITPENTLSELPGIDRVTIQIDVWCESDGLVEEIARAVRDTIEPLAHMVVAPSDGWEAESKCYRATMQFDWMLPRWQ